MSRKILRVPLALLALRYKLLGDSSLLNWIYFLKERLTGFVA